MVRPIDYLRWHETNSGGRHDLTTSDQHAVAGEWGVVPELLADVPDPPDDVTLREQVALVYGVAPANVAVTAGATQANLAAVAAAVGGRSDPPARVLVEEPGYEPLLATPTWLGAAVDRFRRPAGDAYGLSADRVAGGADDRTELAVVTNRHNPSGRRVDRETLASAAAAADEHDARLLVDEVYAPFGLKGMDGPFGGPTAAGIENAVVTGSLTKFFGLGGLRVGWVVGEEGFIETVLEVLHHLPSLATPSVALARRALHNREEIADRARSQASENHDLLASFVAGRDDLAGPVFEGATYAALAHESADGDGVAETAGERGCPVVPGRFFDAPDRFRVSLGGPPEEMAAALDLLGEALDDLGGQ